MSAPGSWSLGGFFFDAWLTCHRNSSLTTVEHPVEYGAAITDHTYVNPERFSFLLGMTDVVSSPGFQGLSNSRSVNALNKLVTLKNSRQPLELICKYGTFNNIVIEAIDVSDDKNTQNQVRMQVNLKEIIVVSTSTVNTSSNPHATNQTNRGQQSAQPVPAGFAQTAKQTAKSFASSFATNFVASAVRSAVTDFIGSFA